jgi:PIN domain nuclease of toxin-antitoxin system
VESTKLQGFHRDPSDQIIVATSRVLGMPVVTADQRIIQFGDVEAIW